MFAADGKRIRGANRHSGGYFETVTLVSHSGRPLASRCCRDEGGERAALRALLDEVDLRGSVITLDALHATRDLERALVDIHQADYLLTIKGNCPETLAALTGLDWTGSRVRHHAGAPEKGHGRIETRCIDVQSLPPRLLVFNAAPPGVPYHPYPHLPENRQDPPGDRLRHHLRGARAGRPRTDCSNGTATTGRLRTATTTAPMPPSAKTPAATAPGMPPANNATLNNIVLALVFHQGFRYLPEANTHFMMRRQEAINAILSPT